MDRFVRVGNVLGIIGGLSLAVGSGLASAQHYSTFSDQVVTGQFTVSATLRLLGATLMTWGLLAIYLRQADRTGRFGLIAIGSCLTNMTLQSGWMFSDLFIAPSIAPIAPQFLNDHGPARLGLAFTLAWIMNTSFILIGITTLRAKVLPRSVGVALIASGAITAIPLPVDGPIYEVVIGIAFAIASVTALPHATQAHVPATTLIGPQNDQPGQGRDPKSTTSTRNTRR